METFLLYTNLSGSLAVGVYKSPQWAQSSQSATVETTKA